MAHTDRYPSRCTVCGGARPLTEPGFGTHQRSDQHRRAVAKGGAFGPSSHPSGDARAAQHAGHIALGIQCACMGARRAVA